MSKQHEMSMAAMWEKLLSQVNSSIDRLSQMGTAMITPLMVAKVSRQLANESARLAELADGIDSTFELTTHTRTGSAVASDRHPCRPHEHRHRAV
ncbi:unnamed protein product [Vitrella brassicaformis CCMP3155]|uniref:Uncharacterized protein n=1 Tax=Vitrella brassicaformis (strain CCMP3155) TaxID=1169540 RepID=A0A0G4FD17_VITBC|nr:unnamed protein product [Vitrella brassicaformis CCMP3155]|eukprot:CEM11143.1 unnamed protein product [Vitrella brassicaformis CCMP3155]